jgi:pyruvate/2-oxoglutarate dehydrogenase complex dihydrolipoamide dehydrogenase (E3) component
MNGSVFDAIVIGAGQAGPPLAGRLTGAGMKVALVERALFGGTCVNTGCTPTKTLIASAQAAHLARRARDYGVVIAGPVTVDMARVKERADAVVAASRGSLEDWLRNMRGCTVLRGQAAFESPTSVRVGDNVLSAPRIFINVGGRALVPHMPGVNEVPHLDNSSILALDRVPEHLVVVGGSYVGLEFAQVFRRFGAAVTVVEMRPHLIPREDADVSTAIEEILRGEGIAVRTNAACVALGRYENGVAVRLECAEGPPSVIGSHVLLAVGRRPNTDDLGLERAGVATDSRGFITVDDRLATNTPGIWALGDCNGRGAFTHTSYNDFEIVAANLLDGASRLVSERIPAYALYTDPPLGRVGLTEAAARAGGRPLLVGARPMTRVLRAVEKGETQGLMKVVADAGTRQILGAAILGVGGDEAIHGVIDMMNARATIDAYMRAVPIHPTVSELIPTVLGEMRPVPPGA